MRIGQTSFISFISKLFSSAAGFVATIYFANVLGAGVLGAYYLLLSIVAWLAIVGTLGIDNALIKRLSEGDDQGKYKLAGGLMIGSLTALVLVGLALTSGLVDRYFGIERVGFIALLLVVGVLGSYADAMVQGMHLVHVSALLQPARRIARTVLQVAGVLAGFELVALVYGYAAGGLVLVGVGLYVVGGPYRLPKRHHVEHLADYARYAWLGRLKGRTFNKADILILGLFVPGTIVGIYGITWNIANFLVIFSTAITKAVFPEVSKLSATDRDGEAASLIGDALGYAGLFTIPGLVGGVLLDDRILAIYGEEFVRGTEVLVILIFAVLLYGYQRQFTNALGGIDQPRAAFKTNGILIGSNIGLNLALVPYFGMVGAAIASVASVLFSMCVGYYLIERYVSVELPVRPVGQQTAAATGMCAFVLLADRVVSESPIAFPNTVVTITLVTAGATVYFGLLAAVSHDFRTTVAENVPGIPDRFRLG
jgi:O-antigen/teichoic acid export membrane protein